MTAGQVELPPPSSGQFLEVSFRRLLASCEEIVAGDNKGRPDLVTWQRSPVFHHAQAQTASGTPGIRPAVPKPLAPLPAARNPEGAAVAAPGVGGAPRADAAVAFAPRQQPQAIEATEHVGREREQLLGDSAAAAPGPGSSAAAAAAVAANARLRTQAHLQEGLTEELAGLAASLKSNTLAMEGKLRERGQLLEGAEAALDTSVAHTKASAGKATEIHRRSRLNLCMTCLIMMVIGLTFAGMYIFIRVTRFAGYKRLPVPAGTTMPPPVPVPPGVEEQLAESLTYERHYDL
eukprot:scaffold8.g1492.t1